jgi:hypothetical protein
VSGVELCNGCGLGQVQDAHVQSTSSGQFPAQHLMKHADSSEFAELFRVTVITVLLRSALSWQRRS